MVRLPYGKDSQSPVVIQADCYSGCLSISYKYVPIRTEVYVKTVLLLIAVMCCSVELQSQPSAKFGRLLSRGYAELAPGAEHLVLISFTDKPHSSSPLLSPKALRRRAKVRPAASLVDEADFALDRRYVEAVARRVVRVRHELRWFNAVSAVATRSQIDELARLPFVRQVEF